MAEALDTPAHGPEDDQLAGQRPNEGTKEGEVTVINVDARPASGATRRKRWWYGAAAATAAGILVAALVISRGDGEKLDVVDTPDSTLVSDPPTTSTAPSTIPPTTLQPTTSTPVGSTPLPAIQDISAIGGQAFPTGKFPGYVAVDNSKVWIQEVNTLERLDAISGNSETSITLSSSTAPGVPVEPAAVRPVIAFGSMWVATRSDSIFRIDSATGTIQAEIAVPGGLPKQGFLPDLGVAADGIWTMSLNPRAFVRIDPATNTVAQTTPAPASALTLTVNDGSLWVTKFGRSGGGGTVDRIDPATGTTLASIPLTFQPGLILGDSSGVWVTHSSPAQTALVAHIDPATNTLRAEIVAGGPFEGAYWDLAFGGGHVWLTGNEALLVRIDPITDTVIGRYGDTTGGGVVTATDGFLWVTSYTKHLVYRIPMT